MLITRVSRITGVQHTMDLPITEEQLIEFGRGRLIQDAMYNLTPAQREFFMTGITEEEWEKYVAISDVDDDPELPDEPDFLNHLSKEEDNYFDEN